MRRVHPPGRARPAALAAALLCLAAASASADFGRNKVRYRSFDWKVLNTDHFEIYYTPEEEDLAWEVTEIAERSWQREFEYFRMIRAPARKIPLFLYATFNDFIQTNVSPEVLEEGVGGFTEVFKTRVCLPLGPSEEQRRIVIAHELVHTYQFNLLYGEGLRSYSLYKSVLVPIWFMEGMAEHVADDWDPQGEMVLRDAVLTDRLPSLTLLHSFNHLEPHDAYLGYKAGQSACDFLGARYGEDKIPAIIKGIEDARTFAQVFQDKVGVPLKDFDRRWHTDLKERFWSWSRGRKDAGDYGTPLVAGRPGHTVINSSPAASRADDRIAFLSDRRGDRNLYLLAKGGSPSTVFSPTKFQHIQGSTPDWSPYGDRIALVVSEGARNAIALVQVAGGPLRRLFKAPRVRLLRYPFLDVAHPRYAPDGTHLAFVGFTGRSSEIYLTDLATGAYRQVTHDRRAAGHPAFTPDGNSIVYESEAADGTRLMVVDSVAAGTPISRPLIPGQVVKGTRPDVSPDGRLVLFDSGEGGAPNLWVAALNGTELRQVTDARTGIWGGRWARDGKRIVATTLEGGCQNIYLLDEAVARTAAVPTPAAPAGPGGPPPLAPAPAETGRPVDLRGSRILPPVRLFDLSATTVQAPDGGAATAGVLLAAAVAPFPGGFASFSRAALAAAPFPRPTFAVPHPAPAAPRPSLAAVAASSTTLVALTSAPVPEVVVAPLALTVMRSGPELELRWATPPGVAGLTRYEVFRATRGGARSLLAVLFDATVTGWRDTTWIYAEPYVYRVEGHTATGVLTAAGEATFTAGVDVWPAPYHLAMDARLVDLFVLVGSITIGGGTSFAGYGALQASDLPGNHRLAIEANAFPSYQNVYGISYAYDGWRPGVSVSIQSAQTHFLLSPSVVSTELRDFPPSVVGSDGVGVGLDWPLDKYDRLEASAGADRLSEVFTDRAGDVIFGPKHSYMLPGSLSFVRDTSRWRRLMPIGGGQFRAGVTQAMPLGGGTLRFTEVDAETRRYVRLTEDASIAVRWLGVVSTGHDRRFAYFGGHYYLRGLPYAYERGPAAIIGNHELRMNLFEHLNWDLPLLPVLLTDMQAIGFIDTGDGFDPTLGSGLPHLKAASIGGGINLVGFMLQSSPIMFSVEVARRIDRHQTRPTVYGRLGPVF